MEPLIVFLDFERETKGSVLYKGGDSGYGVQNVYVRKDQLPRPFPQRIKLTIEDVSK